MKTQKGMTLIELVMVILVLGIIAAVAVPRFVNIQGNALASAIDGSRGAFVSAYTIATAANNAAPTITQIDNVLDGLAPNAGNTGFTQDIDGDTVVDLTVNTFTDAACTAATAAAGNQVLCYTFNPP